MGARRGVGSKQRGGVRAAGGQQRGGARGAQRGDALPIPAGSVPDWGCGCGYVNWGIRGQCFACGRKAPFSIQGQQQRAMAMTNNLAATGGAAHPPKTDLAAKNAMDAKDREIEDLRRRLAA